MVVLAAALLLVGPPAVASADNDLWQEPFGVLLIDEPVSDSNQSAGTQDQEPLTPTGPGGCGAANRKMIATKWYRFVGNGGLISVNTVGSSFDTVIAAYQGSTPRSDDPLPCSDDAGGFQTSALSFQSVYGQEYLVQVGGCSACGTTARGSIVLNVHADPPPSSTPPSTTTPPAATVTPAPTPAPSPAAQPRRRAKPRHVNARSVLTTGTYARPGTADYLGLKIRSLVVSRVPVGTIVEVRCTRGACPDQRRKVVDPSRLVKFPQMREPDGDPRKMRTGTRIYITATYPNWIGSHIRYTIRPNRLKKVQRCLTRGPRPTRRPC